MNTPRGREQLLLLTPIAPAPSGNGLAMRAELFRRSAARFLDVRTVVVPVAGLMPDGARLSPRTAVVSLDPSSARAGAKALLSDPAWRQRLASAGTLPGLARAASPGLADVVVGAVGTAVDDRQVAIHVMRSYLAPLGRALTERLDTAWTTLDLDEDDSVLCAALGDTEDAAAYDRLVGVFGPLFDGVSAASEIEAASIGKRHALVVEPVPNAIELPVRTIRARAPARSILFVGNLTYAPNVEAAGILAQAVLPEVQRRLGGPVCLTLVGAHGPELQRLAGPDVQIKGFVGDLSTVYASASVVVVPLRIGGGTRIKLLEAFAHQVPVVASRVAAAGLRVSDGRHLLLADDAVEAAMAVERIIESPRLARRLTTEALRLVRDSYSIDAVQPAVMKLFAHASMAQRESSKHSVS